MAELEFQIAQALLRWRLVECALHGRGKWLMTYHGTSVPVVRFIREGRISLVGHFPPLCPVGDPDLALTLTYDGEIMRVIHLSDPLDEEGSEVWIDLMVGEPVRT